MNYKDFDTKEQSSPIQLHKTDYNNYADLNHFIEQYNIAQQIIKECGKFYKSFLVSKLMTWEQIINSPYRSKIDFTDIKHLADGTVYESNKILDIYTNYLSKREHIYFHYNEDYDYDHTEEPKDIEIVDDISEAQKKLKSLERKRTDLEYNLAHDIVDNIPEKVIEFMGCFYSIKVTDKITKKNACNWNILRKVVKDYNPKNAYYTSVIKLMTPDVINYCKQQYDGIGKEIRDLDAEIELLENRIKYTQNRNKERLSEELNDFINGLNCKVISSSKRHGNSYDKYTQFYYYDYSIRLFDFERLDTIRYYGPQYKPISIMSTEEFKTYANQIEDYIIGKVSELGIGNIFSDVKDYFIIHNGELKKFSDHLDDVKIELSKNQNELICTNVDVTEKAAYRWPSDAPTIRTTKTTTIIFDTTNNELIDYKVCVNKDEIANKYKRW